MLVSHFAQVALSRSARCRQTSQRSAVLGLALSLSLSLRPQSGVCLRHGCRVKIALFLGEVKWCAAWESGYGR